MLFTGFIASLIARLYTHQANRQRSRNMRASRQRDKDKPGGGSPGAMTRNC
jgi:hypothetical protein